MKRLSALLTCLLLAAPVVPAAEGGDSEVEAPAQLLLRAAELHVGDGTVLRPGELLIEGERIKAVGGSVSEEHWQEREEPEIRDLGPVVLTPGLVDAWVTVPGAGGASPEYTTADLIDPFEPLAARIRESGVTAVCLVADGGKAGGRAAVLRLGPDGPEAVEGLEALVLSLGAASGATSSDARAASVHDLAKDLSRASTYRGKWDEYAEARKKWEETPRRERKNKKEPKKPRHDPSLEKWSQVAAGDLRLLVEVHRADILPGLMDLLADRGVETTLVGCTRCGDLAGRLGSSRAPILLHPLGSVRPPALYGEPDPGRAGHLSRAGARVAAATAGPWPASPLWAATAAAALVGEGMEPGDALAGVTGHAAGALGADGQIGLLREGRLADILVWSGPPLDPASRVEVVLVGGEILKGKLR